MELETGDLILKKASYEDWESIYRNVWSRPETARFMMWRVTADADEAKERMKRTLMWQAAHDAWLVCEKRSKETVGFAGVKEIEPHIYEDTGIALGPEYVGRGYGKQVLRLLMEYCRFLGGWEFYFTTRAGNLASKALARSCGFVYVRSEQKTDARDGQPYELEIYRKNLESAGSNGL